MTFLAPLFLLGALAVALPIIFHLIRRTTKDRKRFSSLMFLLPTPPRLTRRSRLEHLLLLALRCLVLCLLALGFARPLIKKAMSTEEPSGTAKRIVVLVDVSASMKRGNLWQQARDRVEAVLRKYSPEDQVAIFAFDRQVRPVMTFDQWKSAPAGERTGLAARHLGGISPGWSSTHVGHALIDAAETLTDQDDKSVGPRHIVLISDLQEGSRPNELQGYEWPKEISVTVEPLTAARADNAGIQLVAAGDETENVDQTSGINVRVRISNAADSRREQFKVGWARPGESGFLGAATDIYVPPGQSRIVAVPAPDPATGANRIVLQGDDEDFDNTVFVIPPETARMNVLYLGTDSATDPKQPRFFLERAFQETRRHAVKVIAKTPGAPFTPEDAGTLIVANSPLPEAQAAALRELAAAGRTVLFAVQNADAAPTLARLCGANALAVEEARPGNYAMLTEIDFRHPLFAPFADPRFSDFTKIHFWKYRRVDAGAIPDARVVAKFDSGDPALIEVPIGKGRALVLTSGWQPADSQLAVSSKFVPLLYSALDYSGASLVPPGQYFVGDSVPLGSIAPGSYPEGIRLPDGTQAALASGETNFSGTSLPGIYQVSMGERPRRFAVNLDGMESRTAPMPVEELERLGAPVAVSVKAAPSTRHKAQLQSAEVENRQKLWRWFIVATLAILLVETWVAGRTARRLTVQEGATL